MRMKLAIASLAITTLVVISGLSFVAGADGESIGGELPSMPDNYLPVKDPYNTNLLWVRRTSDATERQPPQYQLVYLGQGEPEYVLADYEGEGTIPAEIIKNPGPIPTFYGSGGGCVYSIEGNFCTFYGGKPLCGNPQHINLRTWDWNCGGIVSSKICKDYP